MDAGEEGEGSWGRGGRGGGRKEGRRSALVLPLVRIDRMIRELTWGWSQGGPEDDGHRLKTKREEEEGEGDKIVVGEGKVGLEAARAEREERDVAL